MEKFYKRKSTIVESSHFHDKKKATLEHRVEIDFENPQPDPGLRPPISSYDPNYIDRVRRTYLQRGPCQPASHDFPQTKVGKVQRRFVIDWFNDYKNWLEYSVAKDRAYCLYCYLFRTPTKQGGGDSFVGEGFNNWKKKEKFRDHVGEHNSAHNKARMQCEDLMNQSLTGSVSALFTEKTNKDKIEYRILLNAALDCVRFLLRQGLAFRGNDESELSSNRGNYLELFHWLADHNEQIKNSSFKNAHRNLQLTSSDIQKDLCYACAAETTSVILKDIGEKHFTILVDESRDVSMKEQMAVVLRYVNKEGKIIECFLGIEQVPSTTSISLKGTIDSLFAHHGLSISRLRGQGYDGASNMQGELKGLKTRILNENPFAFYVHCFAHQLQLSLVAAVKYHFQVQFLFEITSKVMNVVGASCKRHSILKTKQHDKVMEALAKGEIVSGRGLNQETNLQRPGDTRWSSHYASLVRLTSMFSSVIEVLEIIMEDGVSTEQRVEARMLLVALQSFELVFTMHLMKWILGITNELSLALQRKEQEIENAMTLVAISKQRLQSLRDDGWDSLFDEVSSFCSTHEIVVPDMNEKFVAPGRPRRGTQEKSNMVYFRVELFCVVLDKQLMELNNRFSKANTELLRFVGCLNPRDSFSAFNKEKLISFARLYSKDFSAYDLELLDNQLETYIIDMRSSNDFLVVDGIANLEKKMVETRKHIVYPLVYMLITLALTLPVATAGVERAFSAMNYVKDRLRNRMGDSLLNACLVTYIEKDVFNEIDNETIMQRFQTMSSRRGQL